MLFQEFQDIAVARSHDLFPQCDDWSPDDWRLALLGELGELANLFKKVRRGDELDDALMANISMEMGDVFAYLCLNAKFVCDLDLKAMAGSHIDVAQQNASEYFFGQDKVDNIVPKLILKLAGYIPTINYIGEFSQCFTLLFRLASIEGLDLQRAAIVKHNLVCDRMNDTKHRIDF